MQIQSVHSISSRLELTGPRDALASFSPGDILQAEVAEVGQGEVVLRLPQGECIKAGQRTMDPLQPGDVLMLQVSQEGGSPRLELVSINGQPLKTAAPQAEYDLLRMQVPPTRANLSIASALSQMGAPARPETFARMAELTARFPNLTHGEALLFAASSLPLDANTVQAFTNWLHAPLQTADFAVAVENLAAQDGQAVSLLETAVGQMEAAVSPVRGEATPLPQAAAHAEPGALPEGLSQSLSDKLIQSGVWDELRLRLPVLPEREGQALILQLLSDLPPQTSGAERSAIYQALQSLMPKATVESPKPGQSQPQTEHVGRAAAQIPESSAEKPPVLQGVQAQEAVQETPKQLSVLPNGLRNLFAALLERAPGEQGQALREAAMELETKLLAFTGALKGQQGPDAARVKPVLEMGQSLLLQVQMGAELGNLLYIPLPITLHETRQDASLYVLRRHGSASKVDEANVTVAICLETQNLGPVDTLLKVERNDITLQFRVEGAQARSFIQSHLDLAAALQFPTPYRFKSANVVQRDTPITPLNAGQTLQAAFGLSGPGSLDISV